MTLPMILLVGIGQSFGTKSDGNNMASLLNPQGYTSLAYLELILTILLKSLCQATKPGNSSFTPSALVQSYSMVFFQTPTSRITASLSMDFKLCVNTISALTLSLLPMHYSVSGSMTLKRFITISNKITSTLFSPVCTKSTILSPKPFKKAP